VTTMEGEWEWGSGWRGYVDWGGGEGIGWVLEFEEVALAECGRRSEGVVHVSVGAIEH
jgi:hypothetical protein